MAWGEPGELPGTNDRRNGNGRRLEDQLTDHRRDAYAHPQLVARLTDAGLLLAATTERRLSALEQFAARVAVLGVIGGVVLGALATVVAARLFGALH